MEKINRFARRKLNSQEVYVFDVILCDNDIDRDGERFSVSALETLSKLFIGKTGIFDHNPKGENQTARIFDTAVIKDEERILETGECYTCLEGRAYILRTPKNKDLIDEIDGGIKKEVSISCSVKREICSVCKADRKKRMCPHIKGKEYAGKVCHVILDEPFDAYEFSFVAIPAQKNAGVKKSFGSTLLKQTAKLFYLCDTVLAKSTIEKLLSNCSEEQLKALKDELEKKLSKRAMPQLMEDLKKVNNTDKDFCPYSLNY